MYHVVSDLETMYPSLDMVERPKYCFPEIPLTASENEDTTIPRICVAPTIEQCLTGIGLMGRFRRCLEANEDARDYSVDGNEVYPILVVEFSDDNDWYHPTKEQVPDVETTGEIWSLHPLKVIRSEIRWMSPESIVWDPKDNSVCKSVRFVTDLEGKDHPWLNGKGHPLESSEDEDEPWCGNMGGMSASVVDQFKFWEGRIVRQPVFAVPVDNAYALCYPIGGQQIPYKPGVPWPVRTAIKDLRRYTGCRDSGGRELYESMPVMHDGRIRCITASNGAFGVSWYDIKGHADQFIPFCGMKKTADGWLAEVTADLRKK